MSREPQSAATMVLLNKLPVLDHPPSADGPTPEFVALAEKTEATLIGADLKGWHAFVADRLLKPNSSFKAALTAFLKRREYSTIYTTDEEMGMILQLLCRIARWPGQIHMVVHACNSERRQRIFRLLGHDKVGTFLCLASAQRDILVDKVGVPVGKTRVLYNWIDTDFFSPRIDVPVEDYVFSCGAENRDYVTLRDAAIRLPYTFKIQSSGFFASGDQTGTQGNIQFNLRRVPYTELRDRYARSRFVVLPLHAGPQAAGVSGLGEAMAMGKAVIVTNSPGIRDYIIDGVTGVLVPPADTEALARRIRELWEHPDRALEMGARARAWIARANVREYARHVAERMAETRG